MRSPSELGLIVVAAAVICLGPALPAAAAQRSVSDIVLVREGVVIADDLYAAGNQVVVQGRVDGDLVASAFEQVVVAGSVSGDVEAIAGSVVVTGEVGGSVRAVAAELSVSGTVSGDVVTASWRSTVSGQVGGEVYAWGRVASVEGRLGGDLEGRFSSLTLGGEVGGNVDVTVDDLAVDDDLVVVGDLGYRSPRSFAEASEAEVGGSVIHRVPLAPNIRVRALFLAGRVLALLAAAVVGLVLMWALPRASARAAQAVRRSWAGSWLRGAAVLASPVVLVLVAVAVVAVAPSEAAFPLLLVLAPLALAALGAAAAAVLVAPVAAFPWVGRLVRSRSSDLGAFLLGGLVVAVVALAPVAAWLVPGLVVPVGIGGWLARAPTTTSA